MNYCIFLEVSCVLRLLQRLLLLLRAVDKSRVWLDVATLTTSPDPCFFIG